MDMGKNTGFIGVGAMGGPLAARMVERGIPILAYDPNPQNLATAVSKGCTAGALGHCQDQAPSGAFVVLGGFVARVGDTTPAHQGCTARSISGRW